MKMKTSAALLAVATASLSVAQDEDNGIHQNGTSANHSIQHTAFAMPKFTNPFTYEFESASTASPLQRRIPRRSSTGIVDPRRIVNKGERQERKSTRIDSKIGSLDGQTERELADEFGIEYSFTTLKTKIVSTLSRWRWLARLGRDIDEHFAPGACAVTTDNFRNPRRPHTLRSLVVLVILLLIVFGTLYSLVEYLLLATRTSACSVSTVYIPVTYSVTAGMADSSSSAPASPANGSSGLSSAATYTSTSTQTLTSYVTVDPAASPITSSTLPYMYTVDPTGSTHWVNGNSPSSGVSLVTATTSVVVTPGGTGSAAPPSTTQEVSYFTLSGFTSTVYSYAEPDTTITSTSTSTNYMTYTLSQVSPSTDTRSSFSGIASGGWNMSTSTDAGVAPAAASSMDPVSTTLTQVYYTPSGDPSTSTTTTFITTTIAVRSTTTITPSTTILSASGFATTITALPITISTGAQPTDNDPQDGDSLPTEGLSSISSTLTASAANATTGSSGLSSLEVVATSSTSALSSGSAIPVAQSTGSASQLSGTGSSSSALTTISLTNSAVPVPSSSGSTLQITNTMSGTDPMVSSKSVAANITSLISIPSSLASASSVAAISSTLSPGVASSSIVSTASNSSAASTSTTLSQSGASPTSSLTRQTSQGSASSASDAVSANSTEAASAAAISSTQSLPAPDSSAAASITSSSTSGFRTSAAVSSKSVSTTLSASPKSTKQATSPSPSGNASKSSQSSSQSQADTISSSSFVTPSSISTTKSKSVSRSTNPFPASSATARPTTGCGEHGDFTIDFDNLPNFSSSDENDKDITQAPPIPNPYHHLTFSDGYVYAPSPWEPFIPRSSPHLAVFLGNATGMAARTPYGNYSKPGEISDGPRESISAFWFDARSAWLVCDNPGPDVCTMVLSAYTWSASAKTEILAYSQNATVEGCPEFKDCQLKKIEFPSSFRGLTGLQVQAFVGKEPKMFFMDDLALRWSDNTCAAGMLRQRSL
ncbi:hypothetical protein LTR37_021428 [Vermiconidia calcicola]|uniref:Uncharacterized protein n=1 Tax=Vermiconidia calcicola TaxID=1690605 RepID=A0ACC3MAG8_9PEZI|nr:hypothetical protein LTR37_021428 [Vermiconidia calcicola]